MNKIIVSIVIVLFSLFSNAQSIKQQVYKQIQEPKVSSQTNQYVGCVDLGLSVLWATCNVGAKSKSEKGNFYTYSEAMKLRKAGYRLPTVSECNELINKCRFERQGNGVKVIGKNGNSIFLPGAGFKDYRQKKIYYEDSGYYWTSSYIDNFNCVFLMSSNSGCIYGSPEQGCLVRLVLDK